MTTRRDVVGRTNWRRDCAGVPDHGSGGRHGGDANVLSRDLPGAIGWGTQKSCVIFLASLTRGAKKISRLSTTDISADGPISHCPAIPAALIRSAHLSMSLRSNFAKYSGLLCSGADTRVPRSCICPRPDSVSSVSVVAWLRRRTMV